MSITTGVAAAVVGAAAALLTAPVAVADYYPGCVEDPAMFGLRPAQRSICDGPINPDGCWQRARNFAAPADYNVWYTPTFGFEGAPIPELMTPSEVYRVCPNTVPFGEPGHVPEGS